MRNEDGPGGNDGDARTTGENNCQRDGPQQPDQSWLNEALIDAYDEDQAHPLLAGLTEDQLNLVADAHLDRAYRENELAQRERAVRAMGAAILDKVYDFTGRFICYPSEAAHVAHVLWIGHTHSMPSWESTPRLAVLSPEKNCGKTRVTEVTELLVERPLRSASVSPAYIFRKVSDPEGPPVILIDEVDTVFGPKAKENEELRGFLNAGHRRGAVTGRCVVRGKSIEPEEFPSYCAVALAGLGFLPDTILSRCIIINMKRRAPGETVEPFRRRDEEAEGSRLCAELGEWAAGIEDALRDARPAFPPGITDRNADVWEAPLAIADAAGGHWPERARVAAVALVADAMRETPSLGIRLLADIRTVFDVAGEDQLATEALLASLNSMVESPWGDMKGRALNSRGLARRLKVYEVGPSAIRVGAATLRGYRREDLHDAWERYLDRSPYEAATVAGADGPVSPLTSATSATSATAAGDGDGPVSPSTSATSATSATPIDRGDDDDDYQPLFDSGDDE